MAIKHQLTSACVLHTGYCRPPRIQKQVRIDLDTPNPRKLRCVGEDGNPMPYYLVRVKPEPRTTYKGKHIHPRLKYISEFLSIPIEKLPPVRRICKESLCINPEHHALKVGPDYVPVTEYGVKSTSPITLAELIASDISPFQAPDSISKEFDGRPLPHATYLAFQEYDDDI